MIAWRRRGVVCLLAATALATTPSNGQLPLPQSPATAASPSPLAPIAWMAGSWETEAKPAGSAKSYHVVTRFAPQLSGRMMTMETSFDGEPVYAGMYAYDPSKKDIGYWYVTPNGESMRGTVTLQGDDQLYDFLMTLTNGIELHFQTKVHRIDVDHYSWAIFTTINKGTTWDQLFAVEYHRVH